MPHPAPAGCQLKCRLACCRKCLCHCETFSRGISNGAEWYLVDGGMQDYNYLFSNCMELTAELSCWKRPPASHLQTEWENNLDSMLALLQSAHLGIKATYSDFWKMHV